MEKLKFVIFTLILSAALFSCSTSRQGTKVYSYEPNADRSSSASLEANYDGRGYNVDGNERKILFSAILSLTVDMPDSANSHIEKIAKRYDGYVNEIGTFRTIIRVKSEGLNDAIDEISALGNVQSKNLSGQDVTEDYLDFKIRLENAEKSRERYLELLSQAENVEAALKVEKELERLNGTIDMLKGKMARIDHLTEFSTITVNLKEKKKPGPLGYIGIGLYRSVMWLFVRN